MRVDGAIPNLLQGISQQAPQSRLPGQCTMQINAMNDPVDGWKRRPPTEFISMLSGITGSTCRWHFYDTGLEQYILCIESTGTLHVFDRTGQHFSPTGATTYLAFTNPEDLSLCTIGDYTVIANSNVLPVMHNSGNDEVYTNSALIYLKDGGEYGRKYSVSLDNSVVATYTTPGGSNPAADAPLTGTDYVTKKLHSQLTAGINLLSGTGSLSIDGTSTSVSSDIAEKTVIGESYTFSYTVVSSSGTPNLSLVGVNLGNFCDYVALDTTAGLHTYTVASIDNSKPLRIAVVNGAVSLSGLKLVNEYPVTSSIPANYICTLAGNIIEVKRISGTSDIQMELSDDRGGQFAKVVQRSIGKPSDLPKYATPGQIVQVTGEGSSEKDDYYLKFTIEHGEVVFGTEGIWRECCRPDVNRTLNPVYMPHALIRLPDGSWSFTPLNGSLINYVTAYDMFTGLPTAYADFTVEHWRYRSSGDNETNREPSFVGKPITFLSTFQDRLVVLSDENASMSATNSYFNFFNKTAATILDSDPVDIPSAGNTVVKLKRTQQHDKNLIIFADKAQFVVPGNKEVTPKSSMVLTTSYESDLIATPVPAGSSVLFPITYGNYAGIREFITSSATDTNSSQPITAHIPKLIPGNITKMVSSSNYDTVLIQSTEGLNKVYMYKYLWQDSQRQQSSWGVWEFRSDSTIEYMFIYGAYVYLVLRKGSAVRLERMDLTGVPQLDMPYNIHLDSYCILNVVAGACTIPYDITGITPVIIQGDNCPYPGAPVGYTLVGNVATLVGVTTGRVIVGIRSSSEYTPTMPAIKDSNSSIISNANLIIGNFLISYKDTGNFIGTVKNQHYPDYSLPYTGRTLGSFANTVGAPVVDTGVFTLPVRKDSKSTEITITTDSHLPLNITAIEWDGDYTKRGRRL